MRSRIAWSLAGLAFVCAVADTAITAAFRPLLGEESVAVHGWPLVTGATAGSAAMGALIVSRAARSIIGWVLCVVGSSSAVSLVAEIYAVWVIDHDGPGSDFVGHLASWVSAALGAPMALAGLSLMFLLAPDGRLPSRRWRHIARAPVVGLAFWEAGLLITPPSHVLVGDNGANESPLAGLLSGVGLLVIIIGLIGAVVSLVLRLRRADGESRQQLRWIATAAAGLPVGVIVLLVVQLSNGGRQTLLASTPLFLAFFLMPIFIGISVLRYRLYDIDLILNRAALLTIATGFAALGYIGLVVAVGALVGAQAGGFWPSVFATAAVALAFQPVRRRVVRVADRIAYGDQAAPYEALAEFSRRLGESPASDALLPAVAEAAGSAVSARSVTARMTVPGGFELSATWPRTGDAIDPAEAEVFPIADGGEALGSISVVMPAGRSLRLRDRNLLIDLARQAALAFENSRLAVQLVGRVEELNRRTAELTESRARIIAARDAERERQEAAIQRDVIRHVECLPADLESLRTNGSGNREVVLARLVEKAVTALESLRQITRGIYPTQLTSYGLGPALAAHLGRGGQAGGLQVEPSAEGVRFGRRTEAAAYFCYLEASDELEPPIEVSLAVVEGELLMQVAGNAGSSQDDRRFSDRLEPLGGTARWASSGSRMILSINLPVPDATAAASGRRLPAVDGRPDIGQPTRIER
jgi:hypothetical protein